MGRDVGKLRGLLVKRLNNLYAKKKNPLKRTEACCPKEKQSIRRYLIAIVKLKATVH